MWQPKAVRASAPSMSLSVALGIPALSNSLSKANTVCCCSSKTRFMKIVSSVHITAYAPSFSGVSWESQSTAFSGKPVARSVSSVTSWATAEDQEKPMGHVVLAGYKSVSSVQDSWLSVIAWRPRSPTVHPRQLANFLAASGGQQNQRLAKVGACSTSK